MIRRITHVALVFLTAASLVVSPVFAQSQETQPPQGAQSQQTPGQTQERTGGELKAQPNTPAADEARSMKMGPDYSNGKHFFPDITGAYRSLQIAQPMLTNSPRIDQLIQGDKLMPSLEDVISLALENNLNISVQKFQPWIEETQLLKAKSGGIPQSGATQQVVLGTSPSVSFNPIITGTVGWERSTIPVNNPFISGTGQNADTAESISSNGYTYNFGYSEGFHTGTNFSVTLNTTRQASNLAEKDRKSVV